MASNTNQEKRSPEPLAPEEDYEHLLEDYSHFAPPAADEVLQGTVLEHHRQRRHHRFRLQVRRPRSDRAVSVARAAKSP